MTEDEAADQQNNTQQSSERKDRGSRKFEPAQNFFSAGLFLGMIDGRELPAMEERAWIETDFLQFGVPDLAGLVPALVRWGSSLSSKDGTGGLRLGLTRKRQAERQNGNNNELYEAKINSKQLCRTQGLNLTQDQRIE
jgi:hypothetical protein